MNVVKHIIILSALLSCSPTVKLAAPDRPIEVNLNIKIEHKIKIEKELDKVFKDSSVF